MVESTSTSGKPEKERLSPSSGESDVEYSPGLKGIIVEPEGVFKHTRTRRGVIAPVDYKGMSEGSRFHDECSAIAESQSSCSSTENQAFAHMASNPEEMAKRFEDQARIQKMQQDMLQSQQESINNL